MTKNAIATIITYNYFSHALTLYKSLNEWDKEFDFWIVIADDFPEELNRQLSKNIHIIKLKEICKDTIAQEIYTKYIDYNLNSLRWSSKAIVLHYLLSEKNYEKALYLDGDLFFVNDFYFLWGILEEKNILLTPHWRNIYPSIEVQDFYKNFKEGLYNAGFLGSNKKGLSALNWLMEVCNYKCVIEYNKGIYADQTYLNLLPVYFENVEIIKHRGCNIAQWNKHLNTRTINKVGEILINDEFPVIFIHFTNATIESIEKGNDFLLLPHLKKYYLLLQKNGYNPASVDLAAHKQLPQKLTNK